MGYPTVTRLGVNQFWYRHWCSDKNYKSNLFNDKLFIDLVKLYINYGLTFYNNTFLHEYFFNKNYKKTRIKNSISNLKFYRKFFFSNTNLGIEHSYLLRNKTGEYFPLKMWIIKYAKWVIICFNCFKPIKKKSNRKNLIKKELYSISRSLTYFDKNEVIKKRFKILFLYVKSNLLNQSYYCF